MKVSSSSRVTAFKDVSNGQVFRVLGGTTYDKIMIKAKSAPNSLDSLGVSIDGEYFSELSQNQQVVVYPNAVLDLGESKSTYVGDKQW